MIPVVGKCFACGAPIYNKNFACPNCGYKFTAGDNRYCPNMNFGLCSITEIPCTLGVDWHKCSIKEKAEKDSRF